MAYGRRFLVGGGSACSRPVGSPAAVLRDYVNATIGFQELGNLTAKSPKSLMRMLGRDGNPQARHLFKIISCLQEREGLELKVHALRPKETDPLAQLEEMRSMLAENVQEWTREWVAQGRREGREEGREEGIERGRAEERSLLCRQAARKFDASAAAQLADALAGVDDPARLAQVGEWIIECETAADLMTRVRDAETGAD